MKQVRVAELKSRLSEYLRDVRKGHPFMVFDRDTPIARLVPHDPGPGQLIIRQPAAGAPKLQEVRLPPRLRVKTDIVAMLLTERQTDR